MRIAGYGLIAACLLLTGCINITTHLAPVHQEVKATLFGDDCNPIIFGFGYGTSTVEAATRNARVGGGLSDRDFGFVPKTIRVVRSIALRDFYALGFGERCIEVTGEP